MAVITELIDAGINMKRRGNLRGAIEHFRQLQATYPGNARIIFELASAWSAFDVPARALPLYQELLALPPGQSLPPKDMPRLYTRTGASLLELGDTEQALGIIEQGLSLHPSYRPLRLWRMLVLSARGADGQALLAALELLLESLAPSRWDVFESEIVAAVKRMRAEYAADSDGNDEGETPAQVKPKLGIIDEKPSDTLPLDGHAAAPATQHRDDDEIAVTVKQASKPPAKPAPKSKTGSKPGQLGQKSVRIEIGEPDGEATTKSDDDEPSAGAAFRIPVDPD